MSICILNIVFYYYYLTMTTIDEQIDSTLWEEKQAESQKAPLIPVKRIPVPTVKQWFHMMNPGRGGNNFKGGSKIGTKIMKHSSKGR